MKTFKFLIEVSVGEDASEEEIRQMVIKDIGSWEGSKPLDERIPVRCVNATKYRTPYNVSNCTIFLRGMGYNVTKQTEATESVKRTPKKVVSDLVKALEPFAEKPTERHDTFPCHNGITTKEKCGRCSRAFAAWSAIQAAKEAK